jgi:hypothetical protein
LGRRDPSPERTLLLRLRSYRLIRRSRWALSSFGFWPRLESPCRLLPVPAAHGSFPTLSPTVCSWMLDPLPRRYTVCSRLFLPRCHRPSPEEKWVGFPQLSRLKRLRAGGFSRLQIFRLFRPPSLLAPQIVPTAANTPAGQPGLLRPSRTRFVTSPRIGYANRPTTGNWRYGDLHPARLRPCRLLLSSIPPISRVEDWRAGLGRCLCSLLSRPFVCECHIISTVPRFQSPPRQT